jgi:hypothetical protein
MLVRGCSAVGSAIRFAALPVVIGLESCVGTATPGCPNFWANRIFSLEQAGLQLIVKLTW